MIVYEQTTLYLETNNLLPENQHGFRAKRSTMSAWAEMQKDWASYIEQKIITGILLWDLSAAFDIKSCNSLHSVKKSIKDFLKMLPV